MLSRVRFLLRSPTGVQLRSRGSLGPRPAAFRPEHVLSEENRQAFIERFQRYRVHKTVPANERQAAVLVPICIHNGQVGILYTLRSTKLNVNGGQVSFPGGKYDKSDRNLEETAVRETREELGIPKETINVWTTGNLIGKRNVTVMPVVGYLGEIDPTKLRVNPDEVEEAFVVSLQDLCNPSYCRYTQFRNSYVLPSFLSGKHRIWGFTGAITHMVLKSLIPGEYNHSMQHVPPIIPGKETRNVMLEKD